MHHTLIRRYYFETIRYLCGTERRVYSLSSFPRSDIFLSGCGAARHTANIGTLLGSFVGVLIRAMLTDEQLVGWGWRLPFLSGILIAFVSMYLEAHGREHNPNGGSVGERSGGGGGGGDDGDDDAKEVEESKHPFGDVFRRENLPALASATLTPMLYGAGFYTS
jgi:MHS family proline/betaine transporter-like MFS transporter